MSFANPTPVKVGMRGTFAGRSYRVAGRVVMSMDDAGQTYYWNEFNLLDDTGESVTLVYEETERGGEWRLFTMFEPDTPMSAAEAASKRVGDSVRLDGRTLSVTLVDESRVYYIEGEAPEGVEVNDVARYFNAGSGSSMIVVSWTGDEVECFRGVNLPRGTVAKAFGLISEGRAGFQPQDGGESSSAFSGGIQRSGSLKLVLFAGLIIALATVFAVFSIFKSPRQAPVATVSVAQPAPLKLGSTAVFDGAKWTLTRHSLAEVRAVGRQFQRHEYELQNEAGKTALLICGEKPGAENWALCSPMDLTTSITPERAAALRTGETVKLDNQLVTVGELAQIVSRSGEVLESGGTTNVEVLFGFTGRSANAIVIARWNAQELRCYRGQEFTAKGLQAAFKL